MSFAQVPNYVPTNGLVGWWPFNGNADDESGNGNNGTVNGATLASDRNGNVNSAYSFDGVDNYITTNSLLNASQDFSFSCWVNSNNNSGQTILNTIPHTIIAYGINSWWAGAGNITFLYGTGNSFGWLNNNYYFSNPNLYLGVWVNHLIVKNGLNWKFYQNGVLIHNYNAPSIPASTISQLVFGHCDPSVCSETFNGQLDDIGIWNRALTDCEIQNLYTSTNPTNTTSQTACDSYTWNGTTYASSGVYTGTTTNCVTQSLNLTINTNTSSSISQTALDSYTWPVNNQTYTTTGAYTAVIPNATGCDSTITLNLTMSFTGINDLSASKLSIYPNPTNGDFTITGLELVGTVSSLKLTDMNGKVVKVLDTKATKFSMGSIKPGVYFLNIISENKQEVLKIVKE